MSHKSKDVYNGSTFRYSVIAVDEHAQQPPQNAGAVKQGDFGRYLSIPGAGKNRNFLKSYSTFFNFRRFVVIDFDFH